MVGGGVHPLCRLCRAKDWHYQCDYSHSYGRGAHFELELELADVGMFGRRRGYVGGGGVRKVLLYDPI